MDHRIWQKTWRWARRRHPKKTARWVKSKYFRTIKLRDWVLAVHTRNQRGEKRLRSLVHARDTKIIYHVKIRDEANPFDPAWATYFETRLGSTMKRTLTGKEGLLRLWEKQAGYCPQCRQNITPDTGWQLHHVIRRVDGGTDDTSNLLLLHPTCHRQLHSRSIGIQPVSSKGGFVEA